MRVNTNAAQLAMPQLADITEYCHPFRDVNVDRPQSFWNIDQFEIQTNSMQDYELENKLGNGAYGVVYKTKHTPSGDICAFKHLVNLQDLQLKKEVQVMQHLSDIPNILPIRDIVAGKDHSGKARAGLVVEFFEAEDHLTLFPKLSKYQVKLLIYQTLETLSAAHSRGVIHRDITPFNVLMNGNLNQAKVIDWGLADYYRPGKTLATSIATTAYKSPEMLLEYRHYDYALDVWATGCLLAQMVFLREKMFQADHIEFTTPNQYKFDLPQTTAYCYCKDPRNSWIEAAG